MSEVNKNHPNKTPLIALTPEFLKEQAAIAHQAVAFNEAAQRAIADGGSETSIFSHKVDDSDGWSKALQDTEALTQLALGIPASVFQETEAEHDVTDTFGVSLLREAVTVDLGNGLSLTRQQLSIPETNVGSFSYFIR